MFRDESERQRARTAAGLSACNCPDRPDCFHVVNAHNNFDRLYPPIADAPKCKHGYNPNACELGFPGCACADEMESEPATPSPAFAAAVEALVGLADEMIECSEVERCRAALVRCHLEENRVPEIQAIVDAAYELTKPERSRPIYDRTRLPPVQGGWTAIPTGLYNGLTSALRRAEAAAAKESPDAK